MSVRRSIRRTKHWPAWAGSVDSLRRIALALETARLAHPAASDLRVVAWLDEGSEVVTGDPDDVLNQLDVRSVHKLRLRIENEAYPYKASPIVTVFDGDIGAALFVESDNPNWARSYFAARAEEVGKGFPKWAHVLRPLNYGASVGLLGGITYASSFLAAARGADYVTVRRLAELLVSTTATACRHSGRSSPPSAPSAYRPPLYDVSAARQ